MEFLFDYYKKIKDPTLYLCNPDMREISAIQAKDRSCVLRFNDLSELTFDVPKYLSDKDGNKFEAPYYSRVSTRRLIKVDEIGWFQIFSANEVDDGIDSYKSVSAKSHQCIFREKGFFSEGRVYKFYDEDDPYDTQYDASNKEMIPSVVGQMHQQLGISVAISENDFDPQEDYGEWTIIYIDPSLKYQNGKTNICRTFKDDNTTTGYDFMVNAVEEAFEVIFDFDFLHHAIKVKRVEDIAKKTNIYLSFDNVVKLLNVEEKADDIVTVLDCSGQDLDIRSVNPMGTNYIVDFSYYMDEAKYHWMSKELIAKLKEWRTLLDENKTFYKSHVLRLRTAYAKHTSASSGIKTFKTKNADLENVRDQYIVDSETGNMIFSAEKFNIGEKSLDERSPYYATALSDSSVANCYDTAPTFDGTHFSFSGAGTSGTLSTNLQNNKLYFIDYDGLTYCKISAASRIDSATGQDVMYVEGVERYSVYSNVSTWLNIYGRVLEEKQNKIDEYEDEADEILAQMQEISDRVNILSYFSAFPSLLQELKHYWIEGSYQNENLAVLETTTPEDAIDLASELYDCGENELARVCQPKFSISASAINFLKIYEFRKYMRELCLGRVITIEKNSATHYYPALTEVKFGLEDGDDEFELVFSNALKLNDWGFTYADLITNASKASRSVISNWNELMDYSNNKDAIEDLLLNPLDRTLRLAAQGGINQEFVVDNTGILGRKRKDETDLFEDEQVRMINNVLLFTDDGWETAKTALGKISYTENGVQKKAYGLLAEVLVGSLVMSSKMKISNESNTITLDDGILIKNADDVETFKVTPDGNVTVKASIAGGSININNNFIVDESGNVRLNGGVTWGTGSSPTQVLYANSLTFSIIKKPNDNSLWSNYPLESTISWHQVFKSGSDIYASYTYDGGATWTQAVKIVGSDGDVGDINSDAVFDALTNDGEIFGCFGDVDGKLYINASYINTGEFKVIDSSDELVFEASMEKNQVTIGGWTVNDKNFYSYSSDSKGVYKASGMIKGSFQGHRVASLVNKEATSGVAFYAGSANEYAPDPTDEATDQNRAMFAVLHDGSLYAAAASIKGTLFAGAGSKIGSFEVQDDGNLKLHSDEDDTGWADSFSIEHKDKFNVSHTAKMNGYYVQFENSYSGGHIYVGCGDQGPTIRFYNGGSSAEIRKNTISGKSYLNISTPLAIGGIPGVTGQFFCTAFTYDRITYKDAFVKIDGGIITGYQSSPYDTTEYPFLAAPKT